MKNNKIIFDDEGVALSDNQQKERLHLNAAQTKTVPGEIGKLKHGYGDCSDSAQKKWFELFNQFSYCEEISEIKDSDQVELYNSCKSSFEAMKSNFQKRNPSDARWLQTALQKGTAKDRANAGALLVTSNPLGNLEALSILNSYTKLSNKCCTEICTILTDLWKEALLPPHRKLISIQMRADHLKAVRKDSALSQEERKMIFAYWFFENELKEYYFEFLKNIQQNIQNGQENNKTNSIVCVSQLLAYAPEKEQMLLTMLINKLGDPNPKVASKALYHLSEVANKHPNMCGVIVTETEKLLFRNNISDRAQHFSLCFLGSISSCGQQDVCSKLVNICFSLFKMLIQKGSINNRIMHAILRCLQKSVADVSTADGDFLSKDMQDTIYRLVHLADIRVSVQTLGLLLQLIIVKIEKTDRFYNALYKKILDIEITTIGTKTGAQLLHILHRAIHIDPNVDRAKAFIKRLLQLSLDMPSHLSAGCLMILNKLLRSRKELSHGMIADKNSHIISNQMEVDDNNLTKFDSEDEETYQDAPDNEVTEKNIKFESDAESAILPASWHHANIHKGIEEGKSREISSYKYDPFNRVPSNAGAEFVAGYELLLLRTHYHPTIKVISEKLLHQQQIDYYGDPLRDFGLPHFLERFAFKNPKKCNTNQSIPSTTSQKQYVAFGTRGKPVTSLTKQNCTEDEKFIFNYLEQKRKYVGTDKTNITDQVETESVFDGEVDDDEFDEYLNGFFGKNVAAMNDDSLNYLEELGGEIQDTKSKKEQRNNDNFSDVSDMKWDEATVGSRSNKMDSEHNFIEESDSNDDSGSVLSDSDDDTASLVAESSQSKHNPKKQKLKRSIESSDNRIFNKKLKENDMSSLFAAADDFSELLEETSQLKGQGTTNAIFNKDKSSEKQLTWEEQRHSGVKFFKKTQNLKTQKKNIRFKKARK